MIKKDFRAINLKDTLCQFLIFLHYMNFTRFYFVLFKFDSWDKDTRYALFSKCCKTENSGIGKACITKWIKLVKIIALSKRKTLVNMDQNGLQLYLANMTFLTSNEF